MAIKKRTKFYLGLVIFTIAIIFLAYVLYVGPHTRIPKTTIHLIYDHPHSLVIKEVSPGDKLKLSFESDEPINIILIRTKDAGKYFNLEDRTVEHTTIFTDETGGNFDHKFNTSGTWGVYFENPDPPPKPKPKVTYWGQLEKGDDDYLYYYMKISLAGIVFILGTALLISSRRVKKA